MGAGEIRKVIALKELVIYVHTLLDVDAFNDYCPNGLQVEGTHEVASLVSGVTANRDLIEAAIRKNADVILVHHGYFWRGETACIVGMKRKRLKLLLEHDISLLAYHLPLDAHPELGNNARLAALLGVHTCGGLFQTDDLSKGLYGKFIEPTSAASLAKLIEQQLARPPLVVAAGPERIKTVGWCTGAGQSFIDQAIARGLDAYISGEISESTVHAARESGTHYFAAGHHATERYGVQALGEHLAQVYGLQHHYVDIDNPV